jgi:hypothetical protein
LTSLYLKRTWRAAGDFGTTQTPLLVLTGTIVRIIPVFPVIFMIVEFQTLNDMIAEAEADISMGLQVARNRDRAAADVKPGDRMNLRGRSISSGVRLLIHDQLNPCRSPAKVRFIRLASVFAGHTRTNHASCAAEAVQIWIPMIDAIEDATKNARIHPSISVE